jgi:hypothetical protein
MVPFQNVLLCIRPDGLLMLAHYASIAHLDLAVLLLISRCCLCAAALGPAICYAMQFFFREPA